jgi:signal transduction histidine kinase
MVEPVRPLYARERTAEKLVAVGRAVLATFSFAAIWAHPTTPVRFENITYALMLAYAVYAITAAFFAWSAPPPSQTWKIISHVFDLTAFSVFIYLTEGPVSPFFLYFVFNLFCAALRFGWRGILLTAIAATLIYSAMAFYASAFLDDPLFELNRFIIRTAYLVVVAALLVYLGAYHDRLNSELAALGSWPRGIGSSREDVIRNSLDSAARTLRTPRVLMVWEEPEEPWTHVALWSKDRLDVSRVPPGTYEPLVMTELLEHDFVYDHRLFRGAVRFRDVVGVQEWGAVPLNARLCREYELKSVLAIRLEGESLRGRLFAMDRRELSDDDLVLGRVVAKLLAANLDQFFYLREVEQSASSRERLRIARDLHDGIIQSLGGVGLQLEALRALLQADPVRAGERLTELQRVIENDQRELRAVVRGLRPDETAEPETALEVRLDTLRERFASEWGVSVRLQTGGLDSVSPEASMEIFRLVNEALANAVRHGHATEILVRVTAHDERVDLVVADNGRGFPFRGRYDLASLEAFGEGPRTLKERIGNLGGSLVIESRNEGATIEASFAASREN